MKTALALIALAISVAYFASGPSAEAIRPNIAERFASAGASKTGESGTYNFDKAHSFIGFKVQHLGLIKVPGYFRDFAGSIVYDKDDISKSSVTFTAKVASVDTGVAGRDAHLRRADFFDAEKFPEMTFKSTKIERRGKNTFVTGDFTMRGVTKSITFKFDIVGFVPKGRGPAIIGVAADTSIKRFDFGVDYGKNLPAGTPGVSNDVEIDLDIEAKKADDVAKPTE